MASKENRLTSLMFRLPAELRIEIYRLVLPKSSRHVYIEKPNLQLSWMESSRDLFLDAAAIYYGSACFYHFCRLPLRDRANTPCQLFQRHVAGTYIKPSYPWIMKAASGMVRELVVDLRITYERNDEHPRQLRSYFRELSDTFPKLKRLYVFLGPRFFASDFKSVRVRDDLEKLNNKWMAPREYGDGTFFTGAIAAVEELCPPECEVRWRVSRGWNVIQTAVKPQA